jgi:hypothetical protein
VHHAVVLHVLVHRKSSAWVLLEWISGTPEPISLGNVTIGAHHRPFGRQVITLREWPSQRGLRGREARGLHRCDRLGDVR